MALKRINKSMIDQEFVNEVVNHGQQLNEVSSQLAQIVTDVKLVDGEDATAKIQSALDKKGWVRIITPGTFLTGRLYIDSDTKLELMPGVKLKKKDGTNHHILVNKGHTTNTRNKNITVKGGTWDLNNVGNPISSGDMSTNPQSNPGIGIVFRGVDNLTIENIEDIGNEWKYAFLITDINKGTFRKININNESDGLHFQPPLNNITIEDISGVTHDDLISFTMGDYPRYSLGQTGNIENVRVENVYGGETTDELIKMVGSGIDGKSIFKNLYFKNLSGYATIYPVYIMKEDQATPNPCLKDTKLENVVFENIDVKISGSQSYFCIGAISGDITIKKLKIKQSDSLRPILLQKCNMSKVVLEDIDVIASAGTEATNYLVRIDNTASEILDQLIFKDSNIKLNSSAVNSLIYPTAKSLKSLFISNLKVDAVSSMLIYLDGANTDGTDVFINNSLINTNILVSSVNKVSIYLSNSKITTPLRTLHLYDGANIRLRSYNSDINVVINGLTAARFLSLTGDLKSTVIPTSLTPLEDDTYFYSSATDVRNKGTYKYNGSRWIKLNGLKEFDVTVTVGTLAANSVTEFTVNLLDVSAYALVFANPTFALPNGVSYSFTMRNAGVGRLRLTNPTTSAITFDAGTQVAWKIKTIDFDYQ